MVPSVSPESCCTEDYFRMTPKQIQVLTLAAIKNTFKIIGFLNTIHDCINWRFLISSYSSALMSLSGTYNTKLTWEGEAQCQFC